MRPLVLTMRAFGPYPDQETIDFRELGERSLFLIHGPTGAGKTSILDAMTYALYGSTSGEERDARQMRSQHAGESAITEVVFEFAIGTETYRVERRPEQERAKRRGDGTTLQAASVTLWRRCGSDTEGEGDVVATKAGDVAERVERLLGFTATEFRQVVVLPQGRFRELLQADSAARERILATLFRTDRYRSVQDELKRVRGELERAASDLKARIADVLDDAGVESLDALQARQREDREALDVARAALEELVVARDVAHDELKKGREATRLLDELQEVKRTLEVLGRQETSHRERMSALARARKAAPLREIERTWTRAAQDRVEALAAVTRAHSELAAAEAALAERRSEWEREQARQGERDATVRELDDLRRLENELAALADARARVAATEARRVQSVRLSDDLDARVVALERADAARRARMDALAVLAVTAEAESAAVTRIESRLAGCLDLARKRGEVAELERTRVAAEKRCDDAQAALDVARRRFSDLSRTWNATRATSLARALAPGMPCPVCGSTEHPSPAHSNAEVPSDAELERERVVCEALATELESCRRIALEAATAHAKAASSVAMLRESLGENADRELDDVSRELEETRARASAAADARRELIALREQNDTAANELTAARRERDVAKAGQPEVVEAATLAGTALAVIESRFPAGLDDARALRLAVRRAESARVSVMAAWTRADSAKADAESTYQRATSDLEHRRRHVQECESKATAAKAELTRAMLDAGFDAAESITGALLGDAEIDHLEREIDRFKETWSATRSRHDTLVGAAQNVARPDLASLDRAVVEAESRWSDAQAACVERAAAITQRQQLLARIEQRNAELAAVEERYSSVGRIADLADGRYELGIPFHRFVLAALLDDVLAVASERLRAMSNSRYTLERSRERGSRRKTTGLDLEVFDFYTGASRAVATLSGGESFLASLALALGLADVVQAYAGGVRLESVFVDEGFGSLDSESLDQAMRALVDLQREGRLVGVISHVPEMRERIPTRLEVVPTRNGSTTRFVVA